MASEITFTVTLRRDGPTCFIPLPFDARTVFGQLRAPVRVTLNGFTYRSTIAVMGGPPCIPLRKSNREAARLTGDETLEIRLELDTEQRVITPPEDFITALNTIPSALAQWRVLSYSHQREHVEAVESAKKPETRARRIAAAIHALAKVTPKKRGAAKGI